MSKRGLTAYSDALRLEHGDALTVTTVYPGYIRTPIHARVEAAGLGLEGRVPAERVEDAAQHDRARRARRRRRATSRRRRGGRVGYALMRHMPRRCARRDRAPPPRAPRRHAPGFVTIRKTASSTSTPASAPNIPWRRACA